MTNVLAKDWYYLLKDEFKKDYFSNLRNFLNDEYKHHIIHPDKENIFNALNGDWLLRMLSYKFHTI